MKEKKENINFLTGNYKSKATSDLPVYSVSFILLRVMLIASLLLIFSIGERVYLTVQKNRVDNILKAMKNNSDMRLSPREIRSLVIKPETILKKLKRQLKEDNSTMMRDLAELLDILTPIWNTFNKKRKIISTVVY